MRVLLINDSTTNPNWGDRAAATSLMRMIAAAGGEIDHAVTEDELRSSSFGRKSHPLPVRDKDAHAVRSVARLCVPPIVHNVKRRWFPGTKPDDASRLIPERWEDFETAAGVALREEDHGWPHLLEAVSRADVAVIHGDGAMEGNGIIPRTDLFLTYIIKTRFGKPTIIVNHTADFDHAALRNSAQNVYPLFDDVVFRDPISVERCASMCAGRYAADTAFWFQPAPRDDWARVAARPTYFDVWPGKAAFDPRERYLCVGGSSLLWMVNEPSQTVKSFAALIDQMRSVYSGQIVLTCSDLSEQVILESLATQLDLPLVGVTTPVQQAVDIVGNADAYVGGRWHSAIFALRGGTPVIPLTAKTFKMQSLMAAAGLPQVTYDPIDPAGASQSLISRLMDCLAEGSKLRNRLRTWAAEAAANSCDNVAFLKDF